MSGNGVAAPVDIRTVERTCQCFGGRRKPPLRIHEETAKLVRQRTQGVTLPPLRDLVLADYRCPSCKGIVDLTVGDVLGVG